VSSRIAARVFNRSRTWARPSSLANPHHWLYDRLTECAVLDEDVILTESRPQRRGDRGSCIRRRHADPEARDLLKTFRPRDLRSS
jgi:hypothetical protein